MQQLPILPRNPRMLTDFLSPSRHGRATFAWTDTRLLLDHNDNREHSTFNISFRDKIYNQENLRSPSVQSLDLASSLDTTHTLLYRDRHVVNLSSRFG